MNPYRPPFYVDSSLEDSPWREPSWYVVLTVFLAMCPLTLFYCVWRFRTHPDRKPWEVPIFEEVVMTLVANVEVAIRFILLFGLGLYWLLTNYA